MDFLYSQYGIREIADKPRLLLLRLAQRARPDRKQACAFAALLFVLLC